MFKNEQMFRFVPVFLQFDSAPLEIGDSFFLVGDRVIPTLDLALQVRDVLLQVPDGRVQLLVLGAHLPNAGSVLVRIFHLQLKKRISFAPFFYAMVKQTTLFAEFIHKMV